MRCYMSSYNVYRVLSTISALPDFIVMAIDEQEARAVATGSLNTSFGAFSVEHQRINGISMLDRSYFNAECKKLEEGKDYFLLNVINERQISISIADQKYVVSRDTAILITNEAERAY